MNLRSMINKHGELCPLCLKNNRLIRVDETIELDLTYINNDLIIPHIIRNEKVIDCKCGSGRDIYRYAQYTLSVGESIIIGNDLDIQFSDISSYIDMKKYTHHWKLELYSAKLLRVLISNYFYGDKDSNYLLERIRNVNDRIIKMNNVYGSNNNTYYIYNNRTKEVRSYKY